MPCVTSQGVEINIRYCLTSWVDEIYIRSPAPHEEINTRRTPGLLKGRRNTRQSIINYVFTLWNDNCT